MKYTEELKIKSIEELKKLNARNLLAYYKAERKRYYYFVSSHTCDCCGAATWDLYKNNENNKNEKNKCQDWQKYLDVIKSELNKKEHVVKNK
jgi:hypothetical protein